MNSTQTEAKLDFDDIEIYNTKQFKALTVYYY